MQSSINFISRDNDYFSNKEKLLRAFALSVINDPQYSNELKKLKLDLGLNLNEIVDTYINYDLDISKNSNETYQSVLMRYVLHMHNLLLGSWHIERQETVLNFIKHISPTDIIDMGFGVPGKYVKYLLNSYTKNFKLTLCDLDESAILFSQALLNIWSPDNWEHQITLKSLDMNSDSLIGEQDLYIFQSSIEHVKNCTAYLKKHVELSKKDAYFLLSLPLGDITPEHYYEWKTVEEVQEWIDYCGLNIVKSNLIHVNPKVDLFADYHNFNYSDFFILCDKLK